MKWKCVVCIGSGPLSVKLSAMLHAWNLGGTTAFVRPEVGAIFCFFGEKKDNL